MDPKDKVAIVLTKGEVRAIHVVLQVIRNLVKLDVLALKELDELITKFAKKVEE